MIIIHLQEQNSKSKTIRKELKEAILNTHYMLITQPDN